MLKKRKEGAKRVPFSNSPQAFVSGVNKCSKSSVVPWLFLAWRILGTETYVWFIVSSCLWDNCVCSWTHFQQHSDPKMRWTCLWNSVEEKSHWKIQESHDYIICSNSERLWHSVSLLLPQSLHHENKLSYEQQCIAVAECLWGVCPEYTPERWVPATHCWSVSINRNQQFTGEGCLILSLGNHHLLSDHRTWPNCQPLDCVGCTNTTRMQTNK